MLFFVNSNWSFDKHVLFELCYLKFHREKFCFIGFHRHILERNAFKSPLYSAPKIENDIMYEHFCFTKLFDTFSFSWRQNFVQLRPDINIFMQSTLHVWDRFLSSFFVMSQQKLLMLVTLIQNYPSESLDFFGMIVEKLTRVKNALEVFFRNFMIFSKCS